MKKELSEEKSALLNLLITLICVLAAIALICGAIIGVSYIKTKKAVLINDEEAKVLFEDLIPKSEEVNDIIWGAGLPIKADAASAVQTVTGAQYRPVDSGVPYKSVDELRAAVAEVYSADYISKTIAPIAFDGNKDEDKPEVASSDIEPRYTMVKDVASGEMMLARDIMKEGFTLQTKIDPSSAHVMEHIVERNGLFWHVTRVKIGCSATVAGKPTTLTVGIVKDADGWRLDDPTY